MPHRSGEYLRYKGEFPFRSDRIFNHINESFDGYFFFVRVSELTVRYSGYSVEILRCFFYKLRRFCIFFSFVAGNFIIDLYLSRGLYYVKVFSSETAKFQLLFVEAKLNCL